MDSHVWIKNISKIMIYWNIYISNKGLRYERYILFIHVWAIKVFPFTNHVFELNFSK